MANETLDLTNSVQPLADAATHAQPPTIFLLLFPIFFIGMWCVIALILNMASGWPALQARYPNHEEPALLKLGSQSGQMGGGMGVSMRGILTLAACQSGLRVSIWPLFGLFAKPFLVPWNEIRVEPKTMLFVKSNRLGFGQPEVGTMTVSPRAWERLTEAVAGMASVPASPPAIPRRQFALSMLLQWLVVTALAASFFYFAPQLASGGPKLPLAVCIGFPGVVFGVGQFIQYLMQRPKS